MHARDLDEAIRWQNATDFGLTAGIHSLDPDEVNTWIDTRRGRQPLRQPRHHRCGRAAPAVRRLEAVHRRHHEQGRRTQLPDPPRHLAAAAAPVRAVRREAVGSGRGDPVRGRGLAGCRRDRRAARGGHVRPGRLVTRVRHPEGRHRARGGAQRVPVPPGAGRRCGATDRCPTSCACCSRRSAPDAPITRELERAAPRRCRRSRGRDPRGMARPDARAASRAGPRHRCAGHRARPRPSRAIPTSRSTAARSPSPVASSCCRSCESRRSRSRTTVSAIRIARSTPFSPAPDTRRSSARHRRITHAATYDGAQDESGGSACVNSVWTD